MSAAARQQFLDASYVGLLILLHPSAPQVKNMQGLCFLWVRGYSCMLPVVLCVLGSYCVSVY
jgi:hypothetical protein